MIDYTANTIRKLRKVVQFAYEHTKYYKKLYEGIDINNINSPEQLPIVESSELSKDPLAFKSNLHYSKIVGSSGTMGSPKLMFRTRRDIEKSVFNQVKLMSICGVTRKDKVAILQPSGIWGYSSLTAMACEKMGISYVELGNVLDELAMKIIENNDITVIDIAPSRLKSLMQCWQNLNTGKEKKLCITKVMCAGEKLNEEIKKKFEDKYGFQIWNQYGSEEFDGLGWMPQGSYVFHLFNRDYLFEVLDDTNCPVKENQTGHLVVTSFYHYGTPLIRYNLNDLVIKRENGIEVLSRNGECLMLYDSVLLVPLQISTVIKNTIHREEQVDFQIQVRKDDQGTDIVKIVMDLPSLTIEKQNELLENLRHCSIDAYELYRNNKLQFEVSFERKDIIFSRRGKMMRICDQR
nr:AMP-binding protein [uncultured Lachnoclostridium sp.]